MHWYGNLYGEGIDVDDVHQHPHPQIVPQLFSYRFCKYDSLRPTCYSFSDEFISTRMNSFVDMRNACRGRFFCGNWETICCNLFPLFWAPFWSPCLAYTTLVICEMVNYLILFAISIFVIQICGNRIFTNNSSESGLTNFVSNSQLPDGENVLKLHLDNVTALQTSVSNLRLQQVQLLKNFFKF